MLSQTQRGAKLDPSPYLYQRGCKKARREHILQLNRTDNEVLYAMRSSLPNQEAFQQHLQASSLHSVICSPCNREFVSASAMQEHLRNSRKHNVCFVCAAQPDFNSRKRLKEHIRTHDEPSSNPPCILKQIHTPLDTFFLSFQSFDYNSSLPPATSYKRLEIHERWGRGTVAANESWSRYQQALRDEVKVWFGAEDDIRAWHTLCRAIGIANPPTSTTKCAHVSFEIITMIGSIY